MKNLYLMMGTPGSGKSTYVKAMVDTRPRATSISRDTIRRNLLKDGELYFSHETEVFNIFVQKTQNALNSDNYTSIYADATFLNEKSRNKFLSKLHLQDVKVSIIFMNTPIGICLERNLNRKGLSRVPTDSVINMDNCLSLPTIQEIQKFKYKEIIIISKEE